MEKPIAPGRQEREEETRITRWKVKSAGWGSPSSPPSRPALPRGPAEAPRPGPAQPVRAQAGGPWRPWLYLPGSLRGFCSLWRRPVVSLLESFPEGLSCLGWVGGGCGRERPSGCFTGWAPCRALSLLPFPDSSLSAAPSPVRLGQGGCRGTDCMHRCSFHHPKTALDTALYTPRSHLPKVSCWPQPEAADAHPS